MPGTMKHAAALLAPVALLVAGCSSGSGATTASATTGPPSVAPTASAAPTCAPTSAKTQAFPKGAPADLPVPPATKVTATTKRGAINVVSFSTPDSLREGVLFVVKALPQAGYTLQRGDAEANEADAPFSKDQVRGILRLTGRATCQTDWTLAYTTINTQQPNSPLLPARPTPSATALPFG